MWLFAAVVLVLAVFVPGFRRFVLICIAVAVLFLGVGMLVTIIETASHSSQQTHP
jgi:type III secretory pathway component EscV